MKTLAKAAELMLAEISDLQQSLPEFVSYTKWEVGSWEAVIAGLSILHNLLDRTWAAPASSQNR